MKLFLSQLTSRIDEQKNQAVSSTFLTKYQIVSPHSVYACINSISTSKTCYLRRSFQRLICIQMKYIGYEFKLLIANQVNENPTGRIALDHLNLDDIARVYLWRHVFIFWVEIFFFVVVQPIFNEMRELYFHCVNGRVYALWSFENMPCSRKYFPFCILR